MAPARACMVSTLFSARSIAMPTSAISSEMPLNASPIFVCASAAVYCALIVSLRVAEGLDLGGQRCSASDELVLLGLELLAAGR